QGVARVDALTFSLFRSGAGTLFLLPVLFLYGYQSAIFSTPPPYLGLALLGAVLNFWTMLGFFWALRIGRLSLMGPLHMSYPLFVFLLGTLFLGEQVTVSLVLSALAILGGIIILSAAQETINSTPAADKKVLASLLALSSSLSWGSSLVIDKAVLVYMPAIALNLIKIGIPCLGFLLVVRSKGPFPKLNRIDLLRAVVSGLLGLVAANLLYFYALTRTQTVWVAPLSSTSMLFSVIFAMVLLGERPRAIHFLGALLVFAGVWFIS
ncbi:MAG: DMT family transporter, partial [Candidatus Binatia bacterium]